MPTLYIDDDFICL